MVRSQSSYGIDEYPKYCTEIWYFDELAVSFHITIDHEAIFNQWHNNILSYTVDWYTGNILIQDIYIYAYRGSNIMEGYIAEWLPN